MSLLWTYELTASAAESGHCSGISGLATGCPDVTGEVGGGGATLIGEGSTPGSPGGTGGSGGGSNADGGGGGSGGGANGGDTDADGEAPCVEVAIGWCHGDAGAKPGEEPDPGAPAVTISDVAHFRPGPPTQRMQPDGWMVVGLPANIYAPPSTQVVSGSLLGAPAEVRFTPVSWHWNYGDGDAARHSTPGATWQSLGLAEFDATPTSHVYRASGTYVIELNVSYAVAYRFAGGPWTPLVGTVDLPAPPLTATAGDAVTVLVDRDCSSAPRGPGC